MKNTFFLIVLLVLSVYIALNYARKPTKTVVVENSPTPTQSGYAYEVKLIKDLSNLRLSSNLLERTASFELSQTCDFLVNGGFYTEDMRHIGLFVSDGVTISNFQPNQTFDGVLAIDEATASIMVARQTEASFAVQSGPIIKLNGEYKPIKLRNDKSARRIIAAVADTGDLVFGVIYDRESKLLGPKLEGLPQIMSEIETSEGLTFTDIINLDGGSASTYQDGDSKFVESSVIGSYFCLE